MEPAAGALKETLDLLLGTGAEFAEIYLERRSPTMLTWDGGRLDDASSGIDAGVGLRIVHEGVTYYANGNDRSPAAILAMAQGLARALTDPPRKTAAAFREQVAPRRSFASIPSHTVTIEARIEHLKRADAAARAYDPRIAQVSIYLIDSEREVTIANSDGVFESDLNSYITLGAQVVARSGDVVRSGFATRSETSGFEMLERETPEAIGREAARIAILQLSAKPAPAGTYMVVLSSKAGGTLVHEACGHVFEGDFIEKGLSVYAGKLGQQVASEIVTVYDDGTLPQKRGTNRIDDEGAPVTNVLLIENGVLRGFLHDRDGARHERRV